MTTVKVLTQTDINTAKGLAVVGNKLENTSAGVWVNRTTLAPAETVGEDIVHAGNVQVGGEFRLSNPNAATVDTSGIVNAANTSFLVLTTSATIKGVSGGSAGRVVALYNNTSDAITVVHNNAATATNAKVLSATGTNVTLRKGSYLLLLHNGTSWGTEAGFIQNSVVYGAALDPNAAAVAGTEGDTYVQTITGTPGSSALASWLYSGGMWQRITGFGLQTSAAAPNAVRNYIGQVLATAPFKSAAKPYGGFTARPSNFTAAEIAAMGFTAVGGATIVDNGANQGNVSGRWLRIVATRAVNSATVSGTHPYAPPTQYIRHEVPAPAAGKDMAYMLQFVLGGMRKVCSELWVCDPTSGAPVKRIYAVAAPIHGSSAAVNEAQPLYIAPDNTSCYSDYYRCWMHWAVAAATVAAYKTPSNTIKFAFRPAVDNGEGNTLYLTDYAAAELNHGLTVLGTLAYELTINSVGARNNSDGGDRTTWYGNTNGLVSGYVPAASSRVLPVPVVDNGKDLYLTMLSNTDTDKSEGWGLSKTVWTLKHPSGDAVLGTPRMDVIAPTVSRVTSGLGHRAMGVIIPAAVVAAKTQTLHANSVQKYLMVDVMCPAIGYNAHITGVYTEEV